MNENKILVFVLILAHSFMMGCPKMGVNLRVAAPKVSLNLIVRFLQTLL